MTEKQAVSAARKITGKNIFGISRRGYTDEEIAVARAEWKAMPPQPTMPPKGEPRSEWYAALKEYNRKRDRAMAIAFSYRRALGYKALFGFTMLIGTGQTWDEALSEVRAKSSRAERGPDAGGE